MRDQPAADTGLAYLTFDTPLGRLALRTSPHALLEARFDSPPLPGDGCGSEESKVMSSLQQAAQRLAEAARHEIETYLRGELCDFSIPVAPQGSDFQRRVWTALREIPYASTAAYGEIARHLDSPGSSRAVGLACGANPIPLIIPCHRVLAAGGRLGGFSCGLERKRWLLHLEAFRRPPHQQIRSAAARAKGATAVQQELEL